MAILGMALLLIAVNRASARWSFVIGTVWGLGFFLPHLYWAHAAVGPVPWVGLSLVSSMLVGAGMAIWAWARQFGFIANRLWLRAPVFGAVWASMEALRHYWPFGGFPWGRLAFSQVDGPLVHLASIGGAPLVSAVVATSGFLTATVVLGSRSGRLFSRISAAASVIVIVGVSYLIPVPTAPQSGTLAVGAVQGNVQNPGLQAFAQRIQVLTNHVEGTEALAEAVGEHQPLDIVLWPENSSDINPRASQDAADLVNRAAEAVGVPLLIGTDQRTDGTRYNDMVWWEAGQGARGSYSKQVPAAFAEYIPMRDVARWFSDAVDLVGTDMSAGQEPGIMEIPIERMDRTVSFGIAICFEVAYDWVLQEAANLGAEILVVPTNNATFGLTAESEQQLAMTRFRAVEHGRSAVQISTVGVSAIILPNGDLVDSAKLFTADQLYASVPLRTDITISDQLGGWPMYAMIGVSVIGLLGGVVSHVRIRKDAR